ncbi:MAG: hypothetical protein IMZ64_05135 [Bacteroidetes bacterium]|nr:hypothetical protein [Bacteroidota bacterium]
MKWISTKDKKPKDDQTVFGWQKEWSSQIPIICFYDQEEDGFVPLFCEQGLFIHLDYWMKLPDPPSDK